MGVTIAEFIVALQNFNKPDAIVMDWNDGVPRELQLDDLSLVDGELWL